jgi:hypothetical protein
VSGEAFNNFKPWLELFFETNIKNRVCSLIKQTGAQAQNISHVIYLVGTEKNIDCH